MERAASSGDSDGVGLRGERNGLVRQVPDDPPAGPEECDGRAGRPGAARDIGLLWTSNAADA
ncbi:hypothetical protein, partial [Streptomyces sp. NPDC059015]